MSSTDPIVRVVGWLGGVVLVLMVSALTVGLCRSAKRGDETIDTMFAADRAGTPDSPP